MVLTFLKEKFPAIPGYEVLEEVGRGGAACLYKACQLHTGRHVLIKGIQSRKVTDPRLLARLEEGFRSASNLVHPNIAQVLDFTRDETAAYLVMEYVDGMSLGERVRRQGRLPEDGAVGIVTQAAQGLFFAHGLGLVHRNVKPDNILVREDGHAKLTDFSWVKNLRAKSHLTDPASILGTPQFMAPEQYQNPANVDARADVYSLAATLYVAVTGALPFGTGKSFTELVEKILKGTMTPASEVVPDISPEVDEAIIEAMSPDPARRPVSCLDFVRKLKRKEKEPAPWAPAPTPDAAQAEFVERRSAPRQPSGVGVLCVVNTFVHNVPSCELDEGWPATVENVSQAGIALLLGRRMEPGTLLSVHLPSSDTTNQNTPVARVNRLAARPFGQWLVGCEFVETLSDDHLRKFLQ
jgi:serine/threonine protein kinase